jgi:lantibiotic leader peptide-processing serine protease
MAMPHVAGIAALIIVQYGHRTLTPLQVKAKIKSGVYDLGKPGKDPYFGQGKVNAAKSLK